MAWNKGSIQKRNHDKGSIQKTLPTTSNTKVGEWSAVVNFAQDDTLRVEIDGPAASELKISVSMELE